MYDEYNGTKDKLIAELVKALKQMSKWFDDDGFARGVPPRIFVFAMREAIRKAKESDQ